MEPREEKDERESEQMGDWEKRVKEERSEGPKERDENRGGGGGRVWEGEPTHPELSLSS